MTGVVLIERAKPPQTVGATRLRSWMVLVEGGDASESFPGPPETLLRFVVEADQEVGDEGGWGLEQKVVG